MSQNQTNAAPRDYRKLAKIGTVVLSVLGALCLLLSAVFGFFGYFSYNHNDVLDGLTNEQLGITDPDAENADGIINIALFGIDTRNLNSFIGRSDSMMILSVDTVNHSIKLTSLLRDTLVPIEGYGARKLNAAYALGGPELALKTINRAFNMNIRDYATVNFAGMADIIDAMGGIEVDISEAERVEANKHIGWLAITSGSPNQPIEMAGPQTLNGTQAVSFARIRKVSTGDGVSNDYGRTDRQRYVMEQLFNKALSTGKAKYPAIIKSLLPYMETSLSYGDILELSAVLTGDVSFSQARIPQGYGMDIHVQDYPSSLGAVKYYSLDYAADMLHAFVYDNVHPDDFFAQNEPDLTPWYTDWLNGNWTV